MTVEEACKAAYEKHKGDCSGFARAVAEACRVTLTGDANTIADLLAAPRDGWVALQDEGAAAAAAAEGRFVLGGLRGDRQAKPNQHGHVVVVVPGPKEHGTHPLAYWGSLHGRPGARQGVNWAWTQQDVGKVHYAAHVIPAQANAGSG